MAKISEKIASHVLTGGGGASNIDHACSSILSYAIIHHQACHCGWSCTQIYIQYIMKNTAKHLKSGQFFTKYVYNFNHCLVVLLV